MPGDLPKKCEASQGPEHQRSGLWLAHTGMVFTSGVEVRLGVDSKMEVGLLAHASR